MIDVAVEDEGAPAGAALVVAQDGGGVFEDGELKRVGSRQASAEWAGGGGWGHGVVVPVYNGADSVPTLVEALSQLHVEGGLEIILVNDGSPDNSLDVCRTLCKRNAVALTVVNLARNFGEHNAVMAGYAHARGEYIINRVSRIHDHRRLDRSGPKNNHNRLR